jgi:hypothetical protein
MAEASATTTSARSDVVTDAGSDDNAGSTSTSDDTSASPGLSPPGAVASIAAIAMVTSYPTFFQITPV